MKLKELRIKKEISQTKIAEILNISQNTISNYEKRNTEPDIKTLIKIADYFNVSLDYLLDRPFNNNIGYIPEDRKDLVKEIINMSAEEVDKLKIYLRGYKYGKGETSEFKVFED